MPRIVHFGLGNFHRAHQAWYTDHAGGWTITGVIMSNRAERDHLAAHGNAYLLGIWGKDGLRSEKISVYDDILLATDQPQEIIDRIADPDTHVVTLTVTEKGYYLRSGDARIDLSAEPIQHDLTSETPKTAIGLLAAGLIKRAGQPLTVISCDNLSDNGRKLGQAMADYLAEKDPDTADWLANKVSFPNAMVDRITPRLGDDATAEVAEVAGEIGLPTVGTEDFSEWVIEDNFAASRPDWDKAGAELVPDVAPFEERKLRLLNASHSYLAYAGQLAGHQFVHEAIADPTLRAGVDALWDEAGSTVSRPASDSIDAYRAALLDRFAVPAMRHSLSQIAMDGSMKLRERLVPILLARVAAGQEAPQTTRAIASWMAFVWNAVEAGEALNDPNKGQLAAAASDPNAFHAKLAILIGLPEEHLAAVAEEASALLAK